MPVLSQGVMQCSWTPSETTAARGLRHDASTPGRQSRGLGNGPVFKARVENLGIEEVLTAARSPWQNPFAE